MSMVVSSATGVTSYQCTPMTCSSRWMLRRWCQCLRSWVVPCCILRSGWTGDSYCTTRLRCSRQHNLPVRRHCPRPWCWTGSQSGTTTSLLSQQHSISVGMAECHQAGRNSKSDHRRMFKNYWIFRYRVVVYFRRLDNLLATINTQIYRHNQF